MFWLEKVFGILPASVSLWPNGSLDASHFLTLELFWSSRLSGPQVFEVGKVLDSSVLR